MWYLESVRLQKTSRTLSESDRLLNTPLRDLGLRIEGTPLESCSRKLLDELAAAGLSELKIEFYLGLEYGVPTHSSNISMLWMDAVVDPAIRAVMEKHDERPCTPEEIMMCLRHEAGHIFCYGYKLYEHQDFRHVFKAGDDFLEYPHWSRPWKGDPNSPDYVKYLEVRKLASECYAQKHPDDDFAETFAVWLDSATAWRTAYADRPAILQKLELVGSLVRQWGRQKPLVGGSNETFSIARSNMTLRDYLNWE